MQSHMGHDVVDFDEYSARNLQELYDSADTVIKTIESGISELEKVEIQLDMAKAKAMVNMESDKNKIREHIKRLNEMLDIVEKNERTALNIRATNNTNIKFRKQQLEQELQKAKACRNLVSASGEFNGRMVVIENIENKLASIGNHPFKVEKINYEQCIRLGKKPNITQGIVNSLTTTDVKLTIMEGCSEKMDVNKRKRKQRIEEDPVLFKVPRTRESNPAEPYLQKEIVAGLMKKPLQVGDIWNLIDVKWYNQWKIYVGFDEWNTEYVGSPWHHPGQIDNSLLLIADTGELRPGLMDDLDYVLVPDEAWAMLNEWYGCNNGSRIARKVILQGMFTKHKKVEVYYMGLKLRCHPFLEIGTLTEFSRAVKIHDIERVARNLFDIEQHRDVRLWNKYLSNTFEHLNKPDDTIQEAGLYEGQVIILEVKNEDGTWPRS